MHKVSAAERVEFARVAKEMYAAGANADGHLLSAVAAKAESPEQQYTRAVRAFGSWVLHHPAKAKNPRRARARARRKKSPPAARAIYRATFTGGGPRTGVTFQASSDAAAVRYATGLLRHKIGARKCVSVRRDDAGGRSSSRRRRRNPDPADDATGAAARLEEFTGHRAKIRRARAPKVPRATWALGKVASVSYIATRDGETAEYVHKFRSRSRPQLVASVDGSQLYLLGGAYSVTDRGIEDA